MALDPFREPERVWVVSGYRGLGFAGHPSPCLRPACGGAPASPA